MTMQLSRPTAQRTDARLLAGGEWIDGPMHNKVQLDKGLALVEDARRRGATVENVGTVTDEQLVASGYYMRPSVVTNIAADAPLVAEEQFCPSVPIIVYDDLDAALAQANDSIYGLGGSIWSKDVDRALELGTRIASGTIWINTHGTGAINRRAPYGGVKQSGIGRKSGLEGVLDYLQLQTISSFEKTYAK